MDAKSSTNIMPNPEILTTPKSSLGLQTYEYFVGGEDREERLRQFVDEEVVELNLEYPLLESSEIDEHISNLSSLIQENDTGGSATVEFRLAEAYMLMACRQIGELQNPSQEIIDRFQEINESIYGMPDSVVVEQILASLWGQINSKRGGVADSLIEELEKGTIFTAKNGESVAIPRLPKSKELGKDSLPTLTEEARQWIDETLTEEYAPVSDVFDEYYRSEIEPREDKSILPVDILEMFKRGVSVQELDGVAIEVDQNATTLSWSSIDSAVVVGMKRKPLTNVKEALGVFIHEVGVHGRRHISGKELDDESLANGLFTEANEGEVPDYLTFEEGLAGTLQTVSQGAVEKWGLPSVALYLNVAFANMGWSPRQVQEVMTKVRVVLGTSESDSQIPDDLVEKSRKTTLTGVVRVFRGTPSSKGYKTSEGITLHYAKDRAYMAGKIKVIPLLNEIASLPEPERTNAWNRLFVGKYDPTNHHHQSYVNRRRATNRNLPDIT